MQDFEFQRTDEVAGTWEPGEGAKWRTQEGALFFLATWSEGPVQFGWFGIYHESLTHLDSTARDIAEAITRDASDRRRWSDLAELSNETPGWGLVRASREKLQLWRDPIGRLPIFRCRYRRGVEWGTRPEILSGFEGKIRRSRLEEFLARTRSERRDEFWQNINRTRAGEYMVVDGHHRPAFVDWWPGPFDGVSTHPNLEGRVRELLIEAAERVARRGGRLVSMSGGVDSSLLLALLASQGWDVEAISMVEPTTSVFDEREVIERILEETGAQGHFFDIGGPMEWGKPEIHHYTSDYGPANHSEAAYVRPFLNKAKKLIGFNDPQVVISGVGADQLFYCRKLVLERDYMCVSKGCNQAFEKLRWKALIKHGVRLSGGKRVPVPSKIESSPSWLNIYNEDALIRWGWSRVYSRHDWLKSRRAKFKSWAWESIVRFIEQYRRATEVLYEWPYLTPSLAEFVFRLPPTVLRSDTHTKILLRNLLKCYVSEKIAFRRKQGVFDEVIWRGLGEHLTPSLEELLASPVWEKFEGLIEKKKLKKFVSRIRRNYDVVGRVDGHEFWRVIAVSLWVRERCGCR